MVNKVSGIYIIINTKTGKIYIGKSNNIHKRWKAHKSELKNNIHVNKHLQASWNKHGEHVFKFQILEYCTNENLNDRERHHIKIYRSRGITYNMTDGGDGVQGRPVSEETRKKISIANSNWSDERRRKHENAIKNRPVESELERRRKLSIAHSNPTEETREKLRKANTGKKHSEETKIKLSNISKGKKKPERSQSYRDNISKSKMGHVVSDETRKKISDSKKGCVSQNKGKPMSEAQKKKVSESVKAMYAKKKMLQSKEAVKNEDPTL